MAILTHESVLASGEAVDAALAKAESALQDASEFATAAQGGLANTALQPNTPVRLGSAENFFDVDESGHVTLGGEATVWDDLPPAGIAAAKTSGPGVSLNLDEMTVDFVAAANLSDFAVLPFQLSHRVKAGSSAHPHVHWEQAQNHIPNWLVQYRWQRQGQPKTTAWTSIPCITPAFTYVSGTLDQITHTDPIEAPANYGMSDILQMRLLRDSQNASGLFAGADPYTALARVSSFDPHVEFDALGSATEYSKTPLLPD